MNGEKAGGETKDEFFERILREFKTRYPVVFKNYTSHSVAILYRNRVEYYGGYIKYGNFASISGEKYDFYKEVEMLRGGGYKQVRYNPDEVSG